MKKTIVALMALAGIASAETYVEYDFTGTSPLNATIGTGGMQLYGRGHTVSDGDLIMGTADGFYSSAGANKAIYENTELDSWSLSLTATLIGGQTCYSVLQFGSTDYTSNKTAFSSPLLKPFMRGILMSKGLSVFALNNKFSFMISRSAPVTDFNFSASGDLKSAII